MKILIAGAGIGGLTTALCLAKAGHEVHVCEQTQTFQEVGAGLQCGANAVRVFQHLGIERQLVNYAVQPDAIEFREHQSGKVLYDIELGTRYAHRYGAAYQHIHRADLIEVLLKFVSDSSNIQLHTNSRVTGYVESTNSVRIDLENGSSLEGELLIGCDGVKSRVRSQLLGQRAEPARFTGNVAWRAMVSVEKLPKDFMNKVTTNFVGPNKHMVMYYLRGQSLLNLVGVVENSDWRDDSWVSKAPWSELERDFAGWHPMVTEAINAVDKNECYRWALYDHAPLKNWSSERVTLLGDAAHATLPFMASGAALAIEDARILDRCLSIEPQINKALKRYQLNRMARTAKVQNTSRRFATLYHIPNPWLLRAAFTGLKYMGGKKEDFLPEYDANTIALK